MRNFVKGVTAIALAAGSIADGATLHVDYNVFWFVFIGVGGGYRYVLAADPAATSTLSDRTYYYKIGLRFGEVVKRVRKRLRNGQGT